MCQELELCARKLVATHPDLFLRYGTVVSGHHFIIISSEESYSSRVMDSERFILTQIRPSLKVLWQICFFTSKCLNRMSYSYPKYC
jgi:hypothetical protein